MRLVSAPESNATDMFSHLKYHQKLQYDERMRAEKNNVADVTSLTTITVMLYRVLLYECGTM